MRIKKISQTTPVQAQIVNTYSESEENGYSCDYTNNVIENISDLISVSLYDDIDGTAGTVTLSDSAANYSYIEIYFYVIEGGGRIHKSVKVSNPNTSYVLLDMTDFDNNALVFNTNLVYINTTEITRIRNRRFTIAESSSWTPYGSVANIVIKKVVGYK